MSFTLLCVRCHSETALKICRQVTSVTSSRRSPKDTSIENARQRTIVLLQPPQQFFVPLPFLIDTDFAFISRSGVLLKNCGMLSMLNSCKNEGASLYAARSLKREDWLSCIELTVAAAERGGGKGGCTKYNVEDEVFVVSQYDE